MLLLHTAGFSRHLSLLSSSALLPALDQLTRSVSSDLHLSLRADADPAEGQFGRPVEEPVGDPDLDRAGGGDEWALAAKGGWMIRMAESFVGEEAFRSAVRSMF